MNVLIATQVRSGTQMLASALEAHPDVNIQSWPDIAEDKWKSLDMFLSKTDKNNIIMCHQWDNGDYLESTLRMNMDCFWANMITRFDKIILLNRTNYLHCYLSDKIAATQKNYGVNKQRETNIKVDFVLKDFLSMVISVIDARNKIESMFRHKPCLPIKYDDLLNWETTINRIQDFIGLTNVDLKPTTYKQESRGIEDIITNYDYTATLFKEMLWEKWITT